MERYYQNEDGLCKRCGDYYCTACPNNVCERCQENYVFSMSHQCIERRLHEQIPENFDQSVLRVDDCHYMCEVCYIGKGTEFGGCFVCKTNQEMITKGLCDCDSPEQ